MFNKAQLTILSKSENVSLARLAVATFASELDFTLNDMEEIKVAVSEAVTNSIIHGYPDEKKKIDLMMEIKKQLFCLKVKDYGVGIEDTEAVLKPSYSTRDQHMGLGLAFIDSFMDRFELKSEVGKGTLVKMVKIPEKNRKKKGKLNTGIAKNNEKI